jgi:purine nucleoside phosphorylase
VIGGTGLQSLAGYVPVAVVNPKTPWGYPSAPIHILKHNGVPIAFLSRHGAYHQIAPHEVPSRANIAALRSIGVRTVIAFSAVGSLQEEIKPRDFVVPDQIIDRTKGESDLQKDRLATDRGLLLQVFAPSPSLRRELLDMWDLLIRSMRRSQR